MTAMIGFSLVRVMPGRYCLFASRLPWPLLHNSLSTQLNLTL